MNIELIADGSYKRTLQVTVSAAAVKKELDSAYRNLGRTARLRGFRAGKAPRKVLEARFGEQVTADVGSDLIQQAYTDGLAQHELEPVSRPSVDREGDVAFGADFTFSISLEVKPSVELDVWTGVDVVYPKAEVADDEVDAAVDARLQGAKRLVEIADRGVEEGDLVMVELTIKDGDDVVASEPGTMIRTAGDDYYRGIESFLVGMEKDSDKTDDVDFDEAAKTEAVAGKKLSVQAKVLSIQADQVPALDDDVAAELGYEGGAEGMRQAVRGDLHRGRDDMARNQARANLLQVLINANEFDVPAGMVDEQLEVLLNELRIQQAYRGVDPRQVHFSEAQLADLRMRSEFAVKGGVILDFVGARESIAVNDDDLERKYNELADERGQSLDAIRGYFEGEDAVDELRDRLLEEKTLDWLLENANLVEPTEVVPDDAAEAGASDEE